MGNVIPFSQIDLYLNSIHPKAQGCLVDTNFLFAAMYKGVHLFSEDAEFLFEKLALYNIPVYTTITTRSELLDLERRIIITEALMGMLAPHSKWRISNEVAKKLKAHKTWIDQEANAGRLPLLTDYRIKQTKELFIPVRASGKNGWLEICDEVLGNLNERMAFIEKGLGLNYLRLRGEDSDARFLNEPLSWSKMHSLLGKTCLSSSDAMLLNVLNHSIFPFIVSGDYDIAYGVLAEPSEKTAIIPDQLYKNKVKNLNFGKSI